MPLKVIDDIDWLVNKNNERQQVVHLLPLCFFVLWVKEWEFAG